VVSLRSPSKQGDHQTEADYAPYPSQSHVTVAKGSRHAINRSTTSVTSNLNKNWRIGRDGQNPAAILAKELDPLFPETQKIDN
jgi:hypothetical protein